MKRMFFYLAFNLLLSYSAFGANKTDKEHDALAGPVRAVRIEKSALLDQAGQPITSPRVLWQTVRYDTTGRITERAFYANESVWSKIVYSYDIEGNRSDIVYMKKASNSQPANANASDQDQSLTEFMRLRRTFKYDSSGNRTEETDYSKGGYVSQKKVYTYDNQGYVKEIAEYGSKDSLLERCANNYGEKGRIVEQVCYDSRGATSSRNSYAYEVDPLGNWTKRVAKTQRFYNGKQSREYEEVIYRAITYDSSQGGTDSGTLSDKTADLTGGTSIPLIQPVVIRKSGGVLQGSAAKRVEPSYPLEAQAQRIGGSVVVEVTVDEAGNVISARALSGPERLRSVCVSAARGWKFHPTTLSDVPAKVIGTITFNFNP